MEDRAWRDLALQRDGDLQRIANRLFVWYRENTGVGEADRACVDVGLIAEGERAGAKHLGLGRELYVNLEPDHRLKLSHRRYPPGRARKPDLPLQREGRLEQSLLGKCRGGDLEADRKPWTAAGRLGEPGGDRDRRDHRRG